MSQATAAGARMCQGTFFVQGHSAYAWKSGFMHNISKMLSTDFDEFHLIGMVL